jgi:hypothetical protein
LLRRFAPRNDDAVLADASHNTRVAPGILRKAAVAS